MPRRHINLQPTKITDAIAQLQSCPLATGSTAHEPCNPIVPGFKVSVGIGLGNGVEVGRRVPVVVGVAVALGVGVGVSVGVPVRVGVPVIVGVPVGSGVGVGGGRLLTRMLTLPLLPSPWFAVTISRTPSPSISLIATATGFRPRMANGMSDLVKLPSLFARYTTTALLLASVTIRSGWLSRLTSPLPIADGNDGGAAGGVGGTASGSLPLPSLDGELLRNT